MRSAPLVTPRTASRIRGSGCRRRAEARLLLAGDETFEDGLGILRLCRLGDLLHVMCDEGGQVDGPTRAYPLSINQSKGLTKPHTGKEKPHSSTTTEVSSKHCGTKCSRLGGLRMSRDST